MMSKRLTVTMAVLGLALVGACGDDSPATNTVESPASNTQRAAPATSTASSEGNVGDITGNTPVAGDDDVVQGNQPMLSSAAD